MRVYLDNCVFNRPFDDQGQSRIRQETEAILDIRDRIVRNEIELVWSYVIDLEVIRNPFPARRLSTESWKELSVTKIGPSAEILSDAVEFRNSGLRDIDSLHVACAIASKSRYFITTDDAILKKSVFVEDISLANPVEFLQLIGDS